MKLHRLLQKCSFFLIKLAAFQAGGGACMKLHEIQWYLGHSSFTGLRFFALFLILSVVVVGWVKRL